MKGKKIAYKFEIEWKAGTFKGLDKGKKEEYKDHSTVCVGRNLSMYLKLGLGSYGVDADWVMIKKSR